MDPLQLVLRLLHILGGTFWVGSTFFLSGFMGPAVRASLPEGGKVMQRLLTHTRFTTIISISSTLTFLSGWILFFPTSGNFNAAWLGTGTGISLTIGAIFGTLGFLHGLFAVGRPNLRITALVREVSQMEGPPPQEKLDEIQQLQMRAARNSGITSLLVLIALIGMSINEAF